MWVAPAGSTVGRVALITSRFQSEFPLSVEVERHLAETFRQGWADPSKVSQDSSNLRPLIQEAKEIFAAHLGVRLDELYFVGEPPLSFHLAINGLLGEGALHWSATDRQPVHAIVHHRKSAGLSEHEHQVDNLGHSFSCEGNPGDVEIYQPINPETGIHRASPTSSSQLVVDKTAYGSNHVLPTNWKAAIWQSRSWQGPSGLGVLALKSGTLWKNPLPSIDNEKVPQSFSIPLLLTSALALDQFTREYNASALQIRHLNEHIRNYLTNVIGDVVIAGSIETSEPSLLSCSISNVDSAKLVMDLADRGFAVDSGSACLSSNMTPSHVLAAMGIPTTGNLRLTLHPQTKAEEVEELMIVLKECVMQQRTAL